MVAVVTGGSGVGGDGGDETVEGSGDGVGGGGSGVVSDGGVGDGSSDGCGGGHWAMGSVMVVVSRFLVVSDFSSNVLS